MTGSHDGPISALATPENERFRRALNGTVQAERLAGRSAYLLRQRRIDGDTGAGRVAAPVPRRRHQHSEQGRRRRRSDAVLHLADVAAAVGSADAFDAQTGAAVAESGPSGRKDSVLHPPVDVRGRIARGYALEAHVAAHQRRYVLRSAYHSRCHCWGHSIE